MNFPTNLEDPMLRSIWDLPTATGQTQSAALLEALF